MLFAEYTLDDLAPIWAGACLLAFLGVMLWPLRRRAGVAAELARFRADPLFYLLALATIASTIGFLAWIATGGRVLSLWSLAAALAFGAMAYARAK